jgi:multiple sugar transport system substrate-binding protein
MARWGQLLIGAVVLMLVLGGCGAGSAGPTATAAPTNTAVVPTATAAPAVTLRFVCRCVRGGVNNNMASWLEDTVFPTFAEKMKAEGREVSATLVPFSETDEKLKEYFKEMLARGGGEDLMNMDGFLVPEFSEAGLIKPLNEIAGPEVDTWEGWAHISQGLLQLLGYQDKVYGIAVGTDTRAIFYRRDLFQQAGIEVPWQPTSWDEVLATARTLKEKLPEVTPLQLNAGTAMGEATTMQGYFMLLLGTGTHLYDFKAGKWIVKSPGILDTLRFYQTVYQAEGLGEANLQLVSDGRDRSFAAFSEGKLAMLVEGDFFWRSVLAPGSKTELPNRAEVVGWAKMPAKVPGAGYRGQDFVTISGGTGTVLNPNTKHPKEAWELLSFMFSQGMLTNFQQVEPRLRVRDDVVVVGDPVMTAMGQSLLPLTTVRPTLPVYPQVSAAVQRMTERVVTGEMTPEAAMDAYATEVTELVGAENVIEVTGE